MGFLLNKIFTILKKKKKTMGGFPFVVYTFDIWIYDRSWKPRCWFEWKYLWIHIKVAPPSMASDRKFYCLCCCKQPVHVLCLKMVLEEMLCKFFLACYWWKPLLITQQARWRLHWSEASTSVCCRTCSYGVQKRPSESTRKYSVFYSRSGSLKSDSFQKRFTSFLNV